MRAIAWMRPEKAAPNSLIDRRRAQRLIGDRLHRRQRVLHPMVELAHGEAQRVLGPAMLLDLVLEPRFASRRLSSRLRRFTLGAVDGARAAARARGR